MPPAPSVLLVDNYDSFVYNLYQYLCELGAAVDVVRHDVVDEGNLAGRAGVLISPGPGHPREAGRVGAVIDHCATTRTPMLGVCLGHQALGDVFGATVARAPRLVHGQATLVSHDGRGVFVGVAQPFATARYHALAIDPATLPASLEATAWSEDVIMGVRHCDLPLEGVQFHPESVLTQDGYVILANWLAACGSSDALDRASGLNEKARALRDQLPPVARAT